MASSAGRRNILRELNNPSGAIGATASPIAVILPLTPTSPEEEVINRRGRRKALHFDVDESPVKVPCRHHSPRKSPAKKQIKLLNTPVRSSPRKRLNLVESADDEFDELSMLCRRGKRLKINTTADQEANLETSIVALSHSQLVQLIRQAASSSPDTRMILETFMPEPDLTPMEEQLHYFHKNIFKAYPRNIWGSQDEAYCYFRVRTHIDTFKKVCMEQLMSLIESENWSVVMEYVLTALSYAKTLPHWATSGHNKTKENCIHQLATQLTKAIKHSKLDKPALFEISDRIRTLKMEDKLAECKKFIDAQLKEA